MKYPSYAYEALTNVRFGGNPLGILPKAESLSNQQTQPNIEGELNYSE